MHRHAFIVFSASPGMILRASLALAATLAFSAPAAAQSTWTGDFFGVWNQALNWSPNGIPNSPTAAVSFTGNNIGTINISSSVQTQSLAFSNPAGGYTLTSSAGVSLSGVTAINVAAGVTGTQTINLANVAAGSLRFPALNNLSITNNSTAAGTTLVIGPTTVVSTPGNGGVVVTGAGTTEISGGLSAPSPNRIVGGLHKSGAGTLILSNPANNYGGGTFVNGGTLILGAGTAIPTGSNVTAASGGLFNIGNLSNLSSSAIGELFLDTNGIFLVPSGNGDYHLNKLTMIGGTVDLSGTDDFWLHLTGAGAEITTHSASPTNTWIGSPASRIQNDTAAPLIINVNPGGANGIGLEGGINLSSAGTNPTFIKAGAGTMRLTSLGNTANIRLAAGNLRVDDLATGGVGALGAGTITLEGGTLIYGGPSAVTTKNLTLEFNPTIQILTPGVNLTDNGSINSVNLSGLLVLGPGAGQTPSTLTLGATNNYGGQTVVRDNAILAIATIANQGLPSPIGLDFGGGIGLGASVSRGTLLLTGTNPGYSTNRRVTIAGVYGQGGGAIGVENPGTSVAWSGQITGLGSFVKTGAGTLTLTNITNDYTGGAYVEAGTLNVGASGAVMPANSNVTVSPGATFQLSFTSGSNSASPLGTLTLDGGTLFAPPTANPDYSLNQLVMTGGAVNLADSGPVLRLVGAGAALTTKASSTTATLFGNAFFGGALVNDTGSPAPINIAAGATASGIDLDAGIRLIANFVKVGAGTMRLTNTANEADFIVQQGALRVDAVGALGSGLLTVNGGRLAYGGDDATLSKPFTVDTLGGTLDVLNAATTLTVASPIATSGVLNKNGPGVLVLNNLSNQYASGIAVSGGRLEVSDDAQLGLAAITVNPFGMLRYTADATTARTFTLNGGTLEAAAGVSLTMNGAAVGGGFLRGAGAFALTGGTTLSGVTTLTSTRINQTGAASLANFTNGGSFTVVAGQTLGWNGGTNTSSGRVVVNGTANVSDFVSDGQISIPNGGVMNNSDAPLLLGGGSRTFIGSAPDPGGAINLGGRTLELNGGLLVNNGTVSGTTNVNYGSVAMGAGTYGVVNVNQGGVYSPGNSPGVSTAETVVFNNGSFTSGAPRLAIELAGTSLGTEYDQLHATGSLSLAGTLEVSLINDFTPTAGDSFHVLRWGTLTGAFSSISLPALAGLVWNTSGLYQTGILSVAANLAGDYNANGIVDAADYTVWRDRLGQTASLPNDDTAGVGPDDYERWKANFGAVSPGTGTGSGAGSIVNSSRSPAVPEPATLALLMFAATGWYLRRGRAAKKAPATR